MTVNISGDTGISQVQAGVITAADIADGEITNAKIASLDATKLSGAITVDSNGYVTKSSQVAFNVRNGQSDLTDAYAIYTIAVHNVGNAYNTTTGIFTAPKDGVYLFTANPFRYNDSADSYATFRLNGSNVYENRIKTDGAVGWATCTMVATYQMSANDTMQVFCYGHMHNNNNTSRFTGYLLG